MLWKTVLDISWWVFRLFLVLALPFWALVRGSVFLYHDYGLPTWLALLGGMFFGGIVISLYLWVLQQQLGIQQASLRWIAGFAFLLVLSYTGYTTLLPSGKNLKNQEVFQEFDDLHPLLRLGTGTLIWLDSDVLVTDLSRKPEDYQRMGLPHKNFSLHFIQEESGYAHALDLRTKSRSWLANFLTEQYFRLMGFSTLRHVGTADHLHVSLAPHRHPHAL